MRNLVVCCDGTWNTPDQRDHGVPVPTNVRRLYNCLALDAAQLAYYHPGIGTDGGRIQRFYDGATGNGLAKNVRSAYAWLARTYRTGDRIFLFGFSRGAYTARAVAAMVGVCGLLDLSLDAQLDGLAWAKIHALFDYYRTPREQRDPNPPFDGWAYHDTPVRTQPAHRVDIHFVGVWDTVGALGVPPEFGLLRLLQWLAPVQFNDNVLSTSVLNARHAVALDECRATFLPTLWQEAGTGESARSDRIRQVWFPGAHADVGGGYAETGLSDAALAWMIEESRDLGLRVLPALIAQIRPDPLDVLHDSVDGLFARFRTAHRPVPRLDGVAGGDDLSASAVARLEEPTITLGPYRPSILPTPDRPARQPVYANERWNATGIFLEAGVRYRLTARGEWIDGRVKCGPDGALPGEWRFGRVWWWIGSMFGAIETGLIAGGKLATALLNRVTRRKRLYPKRLEFRWSRRFADAPWFCLVGVIANGQTGDDSVFVADQTFRIGAGAEVVPVRDGYLYCYANDGWGAYWNNHGSVDLTVEPIADAGPGPA